MGPTRVRLGPADGDRLAFLAVAGALDAFEAAVAVDSIVGDPLTVADYGDYRVYRVRETTALSVFPARTADRGRYPLDVRTDGSRWAVRVEVPERSALATYREYCEEGAIEFELERVVTPSDGLLARTPLTSPQREALVAAYELGYFVEPREASLADVASTSASRWGRPAVGSGGGCAPFSRIISDCAAPADRRRVPPLSVRPLLIII